MTSQITPTNRTTPTSMPIGIQMVVVLLIFVGSIVAGVLGSLVGLGGGVLIVPLLTLAFGLPIYFAIGASIISVIATSSGAAAAYVRDHLTNLHVGMFLELGTTTGAITGAFLAGLLAPNLLFVLFGVILLISAVPLVFKIGEELSQGVKNDRLTNWLGLSGTYPDQRLGRQVAYQVTRTPLGMAMMYLAGIISGLLGIGSGTFKVLAMDTLMRLPMKVSTTTSNFMIGVTAAASAGIYFSRGDVPPLVAAPVALGVLLGANSLIFCWPLFLLLVWGRPLNWRKQTLQPAEVEMVQKRRAVVLWVGVACVFAYLLNLTLEHMIFEPRPFVNHKIHLLLTHPADASFPSDHTAWSFAVVGMLLFIILPLLVSIWHRRDQGWQNQSFVALIVPLLLLGGAIVIACSIGLARVFVGIHYPVDILGGAIDGLIAALLVTMLSRWLQQVTDTVLQFAQVLHVA